MQYAFKGEITSVEVLRDGETVRSYPGKSNLLLDAGMDRLAYVPMCDLFLYAVRGTGGGDTSEVVANVNTYTRAGATVTRTAGTRIFLAPDDVGKYLLFRGTTLPNQGGYIQTVNSDTQVTLDNSAGGLTNKNITLFDVAEIELTQESDIQQIMVTLNIDVDGLVITPAFGGGGAFSTNSVGRALYFAPDATADGNPIQPAYRRIVAYDAVTGGVTIDNFIAAPGATVVLGTCYLFTPRVDNSEDGSPRPSSRAVLYGVAAGENSTTVAGAVSTFKRTFIFDPDPPLMEDVLSNNVYSRSGSTVTRTAGSRNFSADDVGKIIYFEEAGTEAKITTYTNATNVTVNVSGALTGQHINLYGFRSYSEIAFSNIDGLHRLDSEGLFDSTESAAGRNINIRVLLASAVNVYGATMLAPGEQLKVSYQFQATYSPAVSTNGTLAGIITDTGNAMTSKGKTGKMAIETIATSVVTSSGDTDISFTTLEPYNPGSLGISENVEVLDPVGSMIRDSAASYRDFVAAPYVAGDFARSYTARFGVTEAVGTKWRSLMLADSDTGSAIFTFLFDFPQTKSSDRILEMTLQKSWARDFS